MILLEKNKKISNQNLWQCAIVKEKKKKGKQRRKEKILN